MNGFEWYHAAQMASQSQDQDDQTDPSSLFPGVGTRQTQYNFEIHPPQFGSPQPGGTSMTTRTDTGSLLHERYKADTVSLQGGMPIMPTTAYAQGTRLVQCDDRQWVYQAILTNSQASSYPPLPPTYMNTSIPADFQHNGSAFRRQLDYTDADTVMADAGTMIGHPTVSGGKQPEKMSCPITVAKSQARSKKGNAKEDGPKNRDEKWGLWKNIICNLKVDQAHTFSEVAYEMSSIHGFKYAVSTYQKLRWPELKPDKTKGASSGLDELPPAEGSPPRRGRPARSSRKSRGMLGIFECKVDLKRDPSDNRLLLVPSVSSEPYIHQYKILHAIDVLVKGLFDQKGTHWWAANKTALTLSNQSPDNSAAESLAAWQGLYDKCLGIAAFHEGHVMKGTLRGLGVLFDRVLEVVKGTNYSRDPHMLLYIWKVCETLLRVKFGETISCKRYILAAFFLQSLKHRLRGLGFQVSDHLVVLVDSLLRILDSTPDDIKKTVGLGCWKFTEILGSQIGNDHFVVLNLGMYCNRNWGNIWRLSDVEELQARYKSHLLPAGGSARAPRATKDSEKEGGLTNSAKLERIEILYASGLALRDVLFSLLSKRNGDQTRTKRISSLLDFIDLLCLELVDLTKASCSQDADEGKLQYNATTRALAFALEQLALDLLEKITTEEQETGKKRRNIKRRRYQIRRKARIGLQTWIAKDAETVTTYSIKPEDMEKMYGLMDEAIEILRRGDKDCKLRALQLSRQLMTWVRAYSWGSMTVNRRGRSKGGRHEKERDRTEDIREKIFPGEAVEKLETKKNERKRFRKDFLRDATIEKAKTIPAVAKPQRKRERNVKQPASPLPSKSRTCRDCGTIFESRRKLFEQHIYVAQACPGSPVAQDPFMGYSSPREWE